VLLGASLPLVAYAAFYAAHGALAALVFDTLVGLPQRIRWFVAIPKLPPRSMFMTLIAAATFVGVAAWSRLRSRPLVAALGLAIAFGCGALSTARLVSSLRYWRRIGDYALAGGSFGDFVALLIWLPFAIVEVAGAAIAGERARIPVLLLCFLAGAVLQMYPAGDVPHALLLLPAMLPVVAYLLARFVAAAARGGRGPGAAAATLAVAWPILLAAPFVQYRLRVPHPAPLADAGFRRATGIWDAHPATADAAALVDWLAREAGGRRLLVTTDQQMLYFLAGIPSALEREEYVFYLVGSDVVAASDARALADEPRMVATLRAAPPLVVDDPDSPAVQRFRATFPDVARFLTTGYVPVARFGRYRLLAPRAGVDTPEGGSTR